MPDIYQSYVEKIGSRSPNSAGFAREGGGRAPYTFIVGDKGDGLASITAGSQIHDIIKEIIGTTRIDAGGEGKGLLRTLPKAHPLYPWLFAERFSNIVGIGQMTKADAGSSILQVDPFDFAALYETYEMTAEFTPRPYVVCADSEIATGQSTSWTTPDGSAQSKSHAQEWLRYTDFEFLPALEWITAQHGEFKFDAPTDVDIDLKAAGKGQLKMPFQKSTLKVTWYEVPYAYVEPNDGTLTPDDSYIFQGIGHISQNNWYGYPAGSLMLGAVQVQRYVPPMPEFDYWQSSLIFDAKKLCNISFYFQFTYPTRVTDPAAAANNNIIQRGHNLVPFAHTGGWYFAKTTAPAANTVNRGLFPSFPMELLFTNPGVTK